jgi:outer membrane protein OmpA-like peptidoglycan-associated protein
MSSKKHLQSFALFSFAFLPVISAAHDSIAAAYVLPDERFVWRTYNPDVQRSVKKELIHYKPGWFVGGGLGLSEASPEGTSGGFYVKDDRDWGYKIFVGRRQFPHWSAEISYVDTGEAGIGNLNSAIEATIPDATIRYQIPTVSASYHLWGPTRDIDVFGRVGISSIINTVSDDRIPYEKQTPMQLNLGAGVQWRFDPKWFVRAEYDSFDNDASMLSISIGRYLAKHDEHRNIDLPELAPPPPPVEPVVVEEPTLIEETCEQFNGAIDAIQFQVNSDELTEESQAILVESAVGLIEYPSMNIEIQAHTDSSASEEYNQDLSERRAQTIKTFLEEQGVAAERLTAKGFGETQPRATNETEIGRALNRRVEFRLLDDTICDTD